MGFLFVLDAFQGQPDHPVHTDILYTYRKSGLSQDIILREQIPGPEQYGFANPEIVRLVVITEFFQWPEIKLNTKVLDSVTEPALRAKMAAPDLIDQELDFGAIRISTGSAFLFQNGVDVEEQRMRGPVIAKEWVRQGDRTALYESVDLFELKTMLEALPRRPEARVKQTDRTKFMAQKAVKDRTLIASQPE